MNGSQSCRLSLNGRAVELGMLIASATLEDELTLMCGKRYELRPNREHTRYGHQRGVATLAGQRIPIDALRAEYLWRQQSAN